MRFMQALQWNNTSLQLNQVQRPTLAPDEALIRITLAGVCNTDLEIIRGYYPFQGTLGHEFVGIVEEANNKSIIGRRVVCDINLACHHCSMCLQSQPHHCVNRHTLGINSKDGAFAEFISMPVTNLVFIPDTLDDENAVFAEPLAAALEIIEQVDFSNIKELAIIGDGKLGLLIALCLNAHQLHVHLIGRHPENFALLKEPGINFTTFLPNKKFPVVVEASGNPQGFDEALSLTQAKGTLVLKSTYADKLSFNPANLVVNEITLLGSRCGPMEKAIELMDKQHIQPKCLIEDSFSLAEGIEAITKAQQKGILKVLIRP